MKRAPALITGLCISFFTLSAQNSEEAVDTRVRIALQTYSFAGTGLEDTGTIENLIQAYISELDDYRLVYNGNPEQAPEYLLAASIDAAGENRILNLELTRLDSGDKQNYSSSHKNMSDLILGTRALVRQALAKSGEEKSVEAEHAQPLNEERIIGTWQGDYGLELVRLYRAGRGLAIMSSGAQMQLRYTIQDNILKISQSSANTERFYHPVPYAVARQLVDLANPMEWEFKLYANGTQLRGIKTASAVIYERDTILEIIHNNSRTSEWTKISR